MGTVNVNLMWILAATFGALIVGTGVRLVALRNATADLVQKRMGSLKVWWVLALLMSVAVIFGQIGATLLFVVASALAMREYMRLVGDRKTIGTSVFGAMFVIGAIHYGLIGAGQIEIARWFLPIVSLLLLGAIRAPVRSPDGYTRVTAASYWGTMLMVYAFSHALFFFQFDATYSQGIEPSVGVAGWFLFIVILTEMNDIMQAIVGRKFGKTKITPLVSPNKSLEGLAGGVATTVLLSFLLTPLLTTLAVDRTLWQRLAITIGAGIVISVSGFLGDINMSAIKRDAGVKDGSAILPGMGGIIDRIDSLIFTAPAFYYFAVVVKSSW